MRLQSLNTQELSFESQLDRKGVCIIIEKVKLKNSEANLKEKSIKVK